MPTCPLPSFPNQFSIPPPAFYDINGLAGWLNLNPSYKQFFAGLYEFLLPPQLITSTLSTLNYRYEDVPLRTYVQRNDSSERLRYQQQIALFRKVYGFNSNAYVNYVCNGSPPIYYTYHDYKELDNMKAAVQLINKLYPFDSMAQASTLNWQIPFPLP